MCARGCFDRQKYSIARDSSTATRLSQRRVCSSIVLPNALHSFRKDRADVDVESLEIVTAFLQGLDYSTLQQSATKLGYELREQRVVNIVPPENVLAAFPRHARSRCFFQDSGRPPRILHS